MQTIDVLFNRGQHVSRLITGFHLLETKGIKVNFIEDSTNSRNAPHSSVVEARIDGKCIAFDMCDGYSLTPQNAASYLYRVDAYFKRSYDKNMDKDLSEIELSKIRPFGFDYYATYKGNPIDIQPTSLKGKVKQAARDVIGYDKCMEVEYFEQKADYKTKDLKIIFMTRLWDPAEISIEDDMSDDFRSYSEYMIREREKINADRAKIIRELRTIYGNLFVGGIQHSTFAEKYCPDILIPKKLTRKKTYLDQMHAADICIGSMGLHKSIGWKTGEYVAASRAVVAERFAYEVTGNFAENINYIPFDSVEECLTAVERLYNNPEEVYKMKCANETYYKNYLRPERQITNALEQCVDWDFEL